MNHAPLSALRSLSLLLLTANLSAQAYPQITAFVDGWGLFGADGARAVVSQFPQQSRMGLPVGTDVSGGFDLQAALNGSTARARFALGVEPLRVEARAEVANISAASCSAESPVRLVLSSSQSMNLVLRISATMQGVNSSNQSGFNTFLATSPFSSPLAWITPSNPQSQLVPIVLTAGVPLTLHFGSACLFNSGSGGAGATIGVLELSSVAASYDDHFAPGCPGSAGQPTLARAGGNPILGTSFDLSVTAIPSGAVAIGLLGFLNQPIDLGPLGAPGCTVATDIASLTTIPHTAGTGTWSLSIPNQSALLSLAFLQQCLVFDPPANALGLSLSNCGRGVFGQ
jgi:hypothetical protein